MFIDMELGASVERKYGTPIDGKRHPWMLLIILVCNWINGHDTK
jgi:hypothetical protein